MDIDWIDVGKCLAGGLLATCGIAGLEFMETFLAGMTEAETERGEVVAGASAVGDLVLSAYAIDCGLREGSPFMKGIEFGGGFSAFTATLGQAALAWLLAMGGREAVEKTYRDLGKTLSLQR